MLITTTSHLEGKNIKYLGVVTGESIIGANIVKDFMANITDIIGGRSSSYEGVLKEARETAFAELKAEAKSMGANAVIAVDIDYETVGQTGSMLMVSITGTAVFVDNL